MNNSPPTPKKEIMLELPHSPPASTYIHVKKKNFFFFTFQKTYLKDMHTQTKLINTFCKNLWSIITYTE